MFIYLSAVNSGVGVSIFSQDKTDFMDLTLLWVFLAFAVFSVVLGCVLFFVFTGEALICRIDGMYIHHNHCAEYVYSFNYVCYKMNYSCPQHTVAPHTIIFYVLASTIDSSSLLLAAQNVAPSLVKMFRKCFGSYRELRPEQDRVEMEYSTSFPSNKQDSSNNALLAPAPSEPAHRDPSRDAPLRWLALAAFLLVTIATVVSLSVLMIVRSR